MKHLPIPVLVLTAIALSGCGDSKDEPEPRPAAKTVVADLVFIYRADPSADPKRAELVCPATNETSRPACRVLAGVDSESFEPVPPGTACTELYGGPETARVVGRLDGRAIDSELSRVNGCEISRCDSLDPVLGALGLEQVESTPPR